MNKLSKLEQEHYNLYLRGYGAKEIAEKLDVSVTSVYSTQSRINKKGGRMEFANKLGLRKSVYTLQEKIHHVIEFKRSGLSFNGYSKQNDIGNNSLSRWVNDYEKGVLKVENGVSISRKRFDSAPQGSVVDVLESIKKEILRIDEEVIKLDQAISVIKGLDL